MFFLFGLIDYESFHTVDWISLLPIKAVKLDSYKNASCFAEQAAAQLRTTQAERLQTTMEIENKSWNFLFCRYPPQLKYWMPIHYDPIEDGQNKSHLLFSFLIRIVLFLHHAISFIWIITRYENQCFNPRNQNHSVGFVRRVNLFVHRCVTQYAVFTRIKYATTSRNCWTTRYPSRCSNWWAEFFARTHEISCWHAKPRPLTKNHVSWVWNALEVDLFLGSWVASFYRYRCVIDLADRHMCP